jgi:hypothetical protein
MLVYRLEIEGGGPYWLSDSAEYITELSWYKNMLTQHNEKESHPIIREDIRGFANLGNSYICGFSSPTDLVRWFGLYLFGFDSVNAEIVTYESNNVIHADSGRQLAFDSVTSQVVRRESISDFLTAQFFDIKALLVAKRKFNTLFTNGFTSDDIVLEAFHNNLINDITFIMDELLFLENYGILNPDFSTAGDYLKYILLIDKVVNILES